MAPDPALLFARQNCPAGEKACEGLCIKEIQNCCTGTQSYCVEEDSYCSVVSTGYCCKNGVTEQECAAEQGKLPGGGGLPTPPLGAASSSSSQSVSTKMSTTTSRSTSTSISTKHSAPTLPRPSTSKSPTTLPTSPPTDKGKGGAEMCSSTSTVIVTYACDVPASKSDKAEKGVTTATGMPTKTSNGTTSTTYKPSSMFTGAAVPMATIWPGLAAVVGVGMLIV